MPLLRNRLLVSTALLFASGLSVFSATTARAQNTLPTGGKVAAGNVAIGQPASNGLTVTQGSARAVVNWGSFSIGQSNSVTFNQPGASSAILNRVTGSATSAIAGQLNANGQVYLVNPNGIAITKSGVVKVGGGFVASTLDISNQNFMSGNLSFAGKGASAPVSNAGTINAAPGGFVTLLGGTVSNTGTINVPLGKVGLGSGEQATLDLSGDGFLQVEAPTRATTADGQPLVNVAGKIKASGGTVQIRAATVANAIRDAVNVSGVVSASSAHQSGGAIILGGGSGGNVRVTGRLAANGHLRGGRIVVSGANVALSGAKLSARSRTAQGGTVTVTARNAAMLIATTINASGATGGGAIQIGGATTAKAQGVRVDAASALLADATSYGSGGDITVWSTGATAVHGLLSARGGPQGGNGGAIETSGEMLDFAGATIDAGAPLGKPGHWLADPTDLIIDAAAATAIDNALASNTSVALQTLASGAPSAPFALTLGETPSGNGDINVASALAWNTAAALSLSAFNNIVVSAPITVSSNGALVLTYNNNLGGISTGGALTFAIGQGSAQFTGGSGAGASLFINNGTPGSGNGAQYTLIYDTGATATGLQSLSGSSGNSALATPLDASGLTGLTVPLITGFSGQFNGLGNAISNLTIASTGDAGLFGTIPAGATVASVGLTGGSIAGGSGGRVGALSGFNSGVISNSYAGVPVSGGSQVGGLVGRNQGTITGSRATGTVTGNGSSDAGGLVGVSSVGSTITQSFASGQVGGSGGASTFFGGFVGLTAGTITDTYATGAVACSGCSYAGGFAGAIGGGATTNAYATGAVSGGVMQNAGFVGIQSSGTITQSYWDTVTAQGLPGVGAAFGGSAAVTGLTTAALAAALPTGFSPSIWGNVNNQTTPYLITNPGPVHLGSDGSATPTAYTLITTIAALQAIANNLSGHYALANDIDATGYSGFVPIGNSATNFAGDFNGLGNVVANLAITTPNGISIGLFGVSSGTIENIGLVGGTVSSGCSCNAGGLVGSNAGTIRNAYSSASVSDPFASMGGLVGRNSSTITNSYATGTVTGGDNFEVGGLVGANSGQITNAYATGAVVNVAGVETGGLVGLNQGSIANVYAAGPVSGGQHVGGLVGSNSSGGTITNGYWDSDRSPSGTAIVGQNSGVLTSVTALSGADAFTLSKYVNLIASTTPGASGNAWVIVDNDGTLNNASGNGATLPMLASEWQTTIHNAHQLQLVAMNPTGNYTLARNIDASATGTSTGPTTGTDVWGCGSAPCVGTFIPLGNGASEYAGAFNGLGNTISNLTINSPTASLVGLFGLIGSSGSVSNLALTGGGVTGLAEVGALAGESGGTITNVHASVPVTGFFQVGGLIGVAFGSVVGSSASGTVTGQIEGGASGNPGPVGGLIGEFDGGSVTGSSATGAVTAADGTYIGGLIGLTNAGTTVTASFATGNVTTIPIINGGADVGGLIGFSASAVSNSYATGAVTGELRVGGLLGSNNSGSVSNSYATGAVTAVVDASIGLFGSDAGGLIGFDSGATPTHDVYATGPVTGDNNLGGLIGELENNLSNAYSTGAVSVAPGGGGANVGGLVGVDDLLGGASNSYWNTQTSGITDVTAGAGFPPSDPGITAMNTAQLQAGLPSGFSSAVWGVIAGVSYPYLLSFYPTPPQVISGAAYRDGGGATPFASGRRQGGLCLRHRRRRRACPCRDRRRRLLLFPRTDRDDRVDRLAGSRLCRDDWQRARRRARRVARQCDRLADQFQHFRQYASRADDGDRAFGRADDRRSVAQRQ